MKKLIRVRVVAMLCLFFRRLWQGSTGKTRVRYLRREDRRFRVAMSSFFRDHPPELFRYLTLVIFQCWAINDCRVKADMSDEDFAAFLDKLNDFIASAHRFHQRERDIPHIEFKDAAAVKLTK